MLYSCIITYNNSENNINNHNNNYYNYDGDDGKIYDNNIKKRFYK